jgi:hypothetical protein
LQGGLLQMHGTYKISNIDMCDLYLKIVASAPKVQFSLGNELFWFHHKKQLSLWTLWKPYVYSCPFAYNLTSSAIWCQTFNYFFPKSFGKSFIDNCFWNFYCFMQSSNGVIAILQNWWSILFCLLWIEQWEEILWVLHI